MTKPFFKPSGRQLVKVSAKSCRLRFIACGPACIAKGCTARCCDAPTSPSGIRVYVSELEVQAFRKRGIGVTVMNGFLEPRPGERLCPFKTKDHLCSLFGMPERPLGCIVSPFMLNKHGTLIIRNRYKLLPCYDPDKGEPAYRVFRSSLEAIFGKDTTRKLIKHLDAGKGDLTLGIDDAISEQLNNREASLQDKAASNKAKARVRPPKA